MDFVGWIRGVGTGHETKKIGKEKKLRGDNTQWPGTIGRQLDANNGNNGSRKAVSWRCLPWKKRGGEP